MVSTASNAPTRQDVHFPLDNAFVAARLEEIAELLEAREANRYRVRAYRIAAEKIRGLQFPVHELVDAEGSAALTELPGIGDGIARIVESLVATGASPLLESLRGGPRPHAVLATVPGLGAKTAERIHSELGIETLEDLEQAAYDGRLARLPGIGRKRLRSVRESLAGRFRRRPRAPEARPVQQADEPPVAELLSIDEEYRRKAAAGRLLEVAPLRFNPTGKSWLPILHARRDDRRYTALYSNSPQAHDLGMTRDWVVVYREGTGVRGQWTIITARRGPLQGRRVVRGREAECDAHYARGGGMSSF